MTASLKITSQVTTRWAQVVQICTLTFDCPLIRLLDLPGSWLLLCEGAGNDYARICDEPLYIFFLIGAHGVKV